MITEVLLPQLELTMETVTVVSVLVKEGDHVAAGQGLIEVETQKAMSEVPAPAAGYVRGFAIKAGDVIGEKALICYLTSTADESLNPKAGANVPGVAPAATLPGSSPAASTASIPSIEPALESAAIRAVPAARRIARERNLDLARIKPTGPNGTITVRDVESHADNQGPIGADSGWTEIPPARLAFNAQMRKSLEEIPQIVISRRLEVTPLSRKEEGVTFTHKLIRKLGEALNAHAALRTLTDGKRSKVLPVSVAVAIDTPAGLIAPVLREAELASVPSIAARVADLRERAARRAVSSEELKDGPFALTNLGMLGVDFFTPFVFHGQTAVLAVGKTSDDNSGGKFAWFSLAVDHRVVDGAEAARFLETLQQRIAA